MGEQILVWVEDERRERTCRNVKQTMNDAWSNV